MPPKPKKSEPSKKTVEKKKDKIIEDKTFGLKNKKGKKQQQFIKQVTQQVKYGQGSAQKRTQLEFEAKKKKKEEESEHKEFQSLIKPVTGTQKISAGADPKSVLCVFFKQGLCSKGSKCKFSHDLSLEGKAEKRSMYVDRRELEEDTMDKWDDEKLHDVVDKKHGGKTKPKTDIVCKYFLQAIEECKYGWFWECPNGTTCIYRHALPPGFVLKKQKKEYDEARAMQPELTIEQLVEEEREKLLASGKPLTKVTLESFLAWKKRKLKEKRDKHKEAASRRHEAFKAGKTHGISGREMFEFDPSLMVGDEQEADESEVVLTGVKEGDSEEQALDLTNLGRELDDVMATTSATAPIVDTSNGAMGEADIEGHADVATGATVDEGIVIDEELFAGDVQVDEELFDVEEDELDADNHDDDGDSDDHSQN